MDYHALKWEKRAIFGEIGEKSRLILHNSEIKAGNEDAMIVAGILAVGFENREDMIAPLLSH